MSVATPKARSPELDSQPQESYLARLALRFTEWAEKWFPDAYIFAALAAIMVACAALLNGATPTAVAKSFGDGFWSLIPFTMQMTFIVIGGYVVATSPPAMRLIDGLAAIPKSGRGAIVFPAFVSLLPSLIGWGFCAIFSGLLVRPLARHPELRMDCRTSKPLKIAQKPQLMREVSRLTKAVNTIAPLPDLGIAASPSMSRIAGGDVATT